MTIETLRTAANQAMRELKEELKKTGSVSMYFRAWFPDDTSKRFDMPVGTEILMNSGDAKEVLFDWFRQRTIPGNVAAWIFGSDTWMSRETAEGQKHSREEHAKHTDFGFKKLQAMGWVDVFEAITITAQTPTDVLILRQPYIRERATIRWVGPPEDLVLPQSQFGGRQKMWGATPDDIRGFAQRRPN